MNKITISPRARRVGTLSVGAVALIVAGAVFALSGAPAAIGAALIGRPQLTADVKADIDRTKVFAANGTPVTIAKIGGPITTNGTVVHGIDLSGFSGNFVATVSGQVDRTVAATVPGKAIQPQFSLWKDCDNDGVFEWQSGEGVTNPNATIPDQKDRSVTINGTAFLSVYKACHIKLIAFGYASDGSAAGSAELAVSQATVVLTQVR